MIAGDATATSATRGNHVRRGFTLCQLGSRNELSSPGDPAEHMSDYLAGLSPDDLIHGGARGFWPAIAGTGKTCPQPRHRGHMAVSRVKPNQRPRGLAGNGAMPASPPCGESP